jgi:signal peptidase I
MVGLVVLFLVPYFPLGAYPLPDTGSMEPTMTGCDIIAYSHPGDVSVGDVVIVDAEWTDGAVIHRVIEERSDGYILQGDANSSPDPEVIPPDRVVAQAQIVVKTGSVLDWFCDPATDVGLAAYDVYKQTLPF